MDRVVAQGQILDAVYSYAHALDSLDRDKMLATFLPDQPMTFDLSSSGYLKDLPKEMTPSAVFDALYSVLAGCTTTQHLLGAPIVTFADHALDKASVRVQVAAYYCIDMHPEAEEATVRGCWEIDMALHAGR